MGPPSNFDGFLMTSVFTLAVPLALAYLAKEGYRSVRSSQLGSSIALVGSKTFHSHPLSNPIGPEDDLN